VPSSWCQPWLGEEDLCWLWSSAVCQFAEVPNYRRHKGLCICWVWHGESCKCCLSCTFPSFIFDPSKMILCYFVCF